MDFNYFEHFQDAVAVLDKQNNVVYCNEVFSSWASLSVKRIVGHPLSEILTATPQFYEQIKTLKKDDDSVPYIEEELTFNKSEARQVQRSLQMLDDQKILCIFRDVSLEQKLHSKYHQELSEKENLIKSLDEKIYDLSFLLDLNNVFFSQTIDTFSIDQLFKKVLSGINVQQVIILKIPMIDDKPDFADPQLLHAYQTENQLTTELRANIKDCIEQIQKLQGQMITRVGLIEQRNGQSRVFFTANSKDEEINVYFYYLNPDFYRNRLHLVDALTKQLHIILENLDLFQKSITDEKTKLYNQRYFKYRLNDEIRRNKRYKRVFCLIVVDVDHFKKINDKYGHLSGDAVLIRLAQILKESFRSTDLVCRFGGEEFVILALETPIDGATLVAERLRQSVENEDFEILEKQKIKVTISIGISSFPDHGIDDTHLFDTADKALYKAKHSGRNQVQVYVPPEPQEPQDA